MFNTTSLLSTISRQTQHNSLLTPNNPILDITSVTILALNNTNEGV